MDLLGKLGSGRGDVRGSNKLCGRRKWAPVMRGLQACAFLALCVIAVALVNADNQLRSPYWQLHNHYQDRLVYSDLDTSYNELHARPAYTCGRPVANKKLTNLLFQGASSSPVRPKYRPFEIRMPRIIGGDETNPGEFPWTVSVKLNGQPICGGSLIDNSWILTAAHCVVGYNPRNLTVRLGAYRIKDTSESQTIDSTLSLFVVHKQYSMPRPFSNDIALLKMSAPVEFSDFIIPICLPVEDQLPAPTGNDLVDDFNTDFKSNGVLASDGSSSSSSSSSSHNDLGGIIVSTKMSDKEISRCFKRLEQNYLNSIGMGSIEGSAGAAAAAAVAAIDGLTAELSASAHNGHLASVDSIVRLGGTKPFQFAAHQKAAIKLTSLPISNELLREIQSVGSMQSLQLGLQHNDIMAMASDLVASGNGLPTGNAANRERVVTTEGGAQHSTAPARHSHRYPTQSDSTQSPNDIGETTLEGDATGPSGGFKYSGELGIVVGWGWVRENDNDEQQAGGAGAGGAAGSINKGFQSVTLQKVRLPILRNNDCEAWFRSQEKKITLLPSQFCAGYNMGGKDACRGDSGGPMIIEDSTHSGRYKLIGIVSAGIGCARPSLPGLYTRVASFLPWINAQIQQVSR